MNQIFVHKVVPNIYKNKVLKIINVKKLMRVLLQGSPLSFCLILPREVFLKLYFFI